MWQTLVEYLWLCLAALVAGVINALAGGGTLLTFPALSAVLSQPFHDRAIADVLANGTSTVALLPASLGSSWGFRRETFELRRLLAWLLVPSLLGGAIGAALLISFPDQFSNLVPWLILTATLLFSLQPYLARRLAINSQHPQPSPNFQSSIPARSLAGMIVLQLLISIYGGYFGAGIGILMLSGLGMMGLTNMHQMNGLKSALALVINGIAVIIFVATQKVVWPYALVMMAASLVGGYVAAHFSRQIPGRYVRWLVMGIGYFLTAWYFAKTYGLGVL